MSVSSPGPSNVTIIPGRVGQACAESGDGVNQRDEEQAGDGKWRMKSLQPRPEGQQRFAAGMAAFCDAVAYGSTALHCAASTAPRTIARGSEMEKKPILATALAITPACWFLSVHPDDSVRRTTIVCIT